MRKPDLAYLKPEVIGSDDESVSEFVIEIISPTDNILRVNRNLNEYFAAGVKVVWHIFPEDEMVYVFTSPLHVTICQGNIVCSAAPVLPDFDLPARDIFVK